MTWCLICGRPARLRGQMVLCDQCAAVCKQILETASKGATREEILESLSQGGGDARAG